MQRAAYFLREAWRGLWHHRALTWTGLPVLAGALVVPAVFLVVLVNAQRAVESVGDRREMFVYLIDESADSTRIAVRERLEAVADTIVYVSKEDAWEEMVEELGGSEMLEEVGENPLPASYRIGLRAEFLHFEAMDSIAGAAAAWEGVEDVEFGGEWVQRLDRFVETLRWTAFAVGALVALVVVLVVANTIRLTILARREIHRVLRLLGAGGAFLRVPLVLEGMLASGVAALVALGLLYGTFRAVSERVSFLPAFPPLAWLGYFVLAAVLLGAAGSWLALARLAPAEERKR